MRLTPALWNCLDLMASATAWMVAESRTVEESSSDLRDDRQPSSRSRRSP